MLLLGSQAQRLFGASRHHQRDRPDAARRHRAQKDSLCDRDGRVAGQDPLQRSIRKARLGLRDRRPARFYLRHRLHDQGHHFGRGDATGRAREAEARRAGGEAPAATGQARRDRRVRCCWKTGAAPGDQAHHAAPSAHAHLRIRVSHVVRGDVQVHAGDRASPDWRRGSAGASGLRAGHPLAVRLQRRLDRTSGRGCQRAEPGAIFPAQYSPAARE